VPASVLAAAAEKAAILVADDNEVNRDLLSKRLTREGHVVTSPRTATRLELLRQQRFDLVLLDSSCRPERMAVLDQMKADDCLRHVPVIMVSACDLIDGVVHCIERGAEDYLTKPFNPVLLKARINACLEKKRLARSRGAVPGAA